MAGYVIELTLGDETFKLAHVTVQEMAKVKQRKGENPRFSEADFDLDDFDAKFVDEAGREVEPSFETNKDGSIKTNKDGDPVPVLKNGRVVWLYSDTKEEVPPTEAA